MYSFKFQESCMAASPLSSSSLLSSLSWVLLPSQKILKLTVKASYKYLNDENDETIEHFETLLAKASVYSLVAEHTGLISRIKFKNLENQCFV